MPINPHTNDVLATAWADQFGVELRDEAKGLLEEALHEIGLCTSAMGNLTAMLLDTALQVGAIAMGNCLERQGRLKEVVD